MIYLYYVNDVNPIGNSERKQEIAQMMQDQIAQSKGELSEEDFEIVETRQIHNRMKRIYEEVNHA